MKKIVKCALFALAAFVMLLAPGQVGAVEIPELHTQVLAQGLSHPWDIAQLPDGSLLFTQRSGTLSLLKEGEVLDIAFLPQVNARGEGGLMGMAVDSDFDTNRFIYLAYNTIAQGAAEVRVTRYTLSQVLSLENAVDIVKGIPANQSGRHSGNQLEMGSDGVLWIGTGDAATAAHPQDPKSLGGKILRVDREGNPAPGNLGQPFDPRIFSYGHRNTQGIALLEAPEGGVWGYSTQHGPGTDDEFNPLVPGNFGWAPLPPYNEGVPMTDLQRFPDAVEAVWQSSRPTLAVSGLARLMGAHWGTLEGAYVMGGLKSAQLRLLMLSDGALAWEKALFYNEFGRIRGVTLGHDGMLYLTTDNGRDNIIRVSPQSLQETP